MFCRSRVVRRLEMPGFHQKWHPLPGRGEKAANLGFPVIPAGPLNVLPAASPLNFFCMQPELCTHWGFPPFSSLAAVVPLAALLPPPGVPLLPQRGSGASWCVCLLPAVPGASGWHAHLSQLFCRFPGASWLVRASCDPPRLARGFPPGARLCRWPD